MLQQFLLALLVAAVIANMVLRFIEDRRIARAQLKLSRQYAGILGRVLAMSRMMHCWARHWGEPPEVLRPLLQRAATDPSYDPEPLGADDGA